MGNTENNEITLRLSELSGKPTSEVFMDWAKENPMIQALAKLSPEEREIVLRDLRVILDLPIKVRQEKL